MDLGPLLGADVIVEDKGGAGGAIGSETVARAAPDGKTILLASLGSQVISPALRPPHGYDPVKSFEPVMLVGAVPTLLVIGPKSGATTLKELIAKAKGGQAMAYGSAGPGTTMNIAGELLNAAAGLKVAHVPYRGAAPALSDLMGGQIDMLNADFPVLLPLVNAGKVKALALYGTERSPLLPDVPTTAELGLPDVVMENWYGVFLPAGTPAAVRDKLEKALFEVVAQPDVKERFATQGMHGTLGQRRLQRAPCQGIPLLAGDDPEARHQGGVTGRRRPKGNFWLRPQFQTAQMRKTTSAKNGAREITMPYAATRRAPCAS